MSVGWRVYYAINLEVAIAVSSWKLKEFYFFTASYMDIYESCDELLAYGITEPSWYYIKPHNTSNSYRVKCFDTGKIVNECCLR